MTPSQPRGEVILQARRICKAYPGVRALDDVSITLRRGRLHALLGENGAGKSTFMNILAGVVSPDGGEIILEGRRVRFRSPRDAREAGIAMIFQELNLVPDLTVAQNLFLGREPLTRVGLIDAALMNRETKHWLRKMNLDVAPSTPVGSLRLGQQQVVEIAKALSMNAKVIIMDEPTSALSEQEVWRLHALIRQLKRDGVALVYITHKLDELPLIADEFTVMRDGRYVGSRAEAGATRDEIVRMMVGRDMTEIFSRTPREETTVPSKERLRVESLFLLPARGASNCVLSDVSLTLARGEVLGIFGLMGAGRTELLESLFGLHDARLRGRIFLDEQPLVLRNPRDAIDAGIVLAPEDRKRDGLVLSLSVAANTSLASLERIERAGFLSKSLEEDLAKSFVKQLHTKTANIHERVRNLSGGNQQKVVLAKWLATGPKVLLLDEPTRGIDVGAKKEIYALIDTFVADGLSVVLVSSELPEILGISDRILVMCEGRKTGEFSRGEGNEQEIMKAALPLRSSKPDGVAFFSSGARL